MVLDARKYLTVLSISCSYPQLLSGFGLQQRIVSRQMIDFHSYWEIQTSSFVECVYVAQQALTNYEQLAYLIVPPLEREWFSLNNFHLHQDQGGDELSNRMKQVLMFVKCSFYLQQVLCPHYPFFGIHRSTIHL